jgi:hypothetical protein
LCFRHRNGYGSLRAKARALNDFPQGYSSTDGALAVLKSASRQWPTT